MTNAERDELISLIEGYTNIVANNEVWLSFSTLRKVTEHNVVMENNAKMAMLQYIEKFVGGDK